MNGQRLFIAVNFNEETKRQMRKIACTLKKYMKRGSLTRRENLHLTLAFLGEVAEDRVYDVKCAMDTIDCSALELRFNRIGSFSRGAESLFWLGALENQQLTEMQKELICQLRQRGFQPDGKQFRPHVTLARRAVMDSGFQLETVNEELPEITQRIDRISLVRSERIKGILTYTEIYSAEF
ncbi:RNA 2',3'-cyclic phosphodiesterase [Anaerovorax odorimutans]|uniref:RNA 2',3'-cyclic phosphodiesterase n=1 Tax=Anaerovorax odorimutans TaxID=109327 RepID=A0ABT1RLX5_9FIRM|nr:RNA 2',3'-cyclic phosphodiesterase [Anaerovorax odorimutans]MCQ4636196.1 RNA 2',3'-cyclic phosphodiesterase [Anaerovorax odorimutans]